MAGELTNQGPTVLQGAGIGTNPAPNIPVAAPADPAKLLISTRRYLNLRKFKKFQFLSFPRMSENSLQWGISSIP